MKNFDTDGADVIEYMKTNMVLPFSTFQMTDKSTYFSHMSMSKLNISHTDKGYYIYLEKCIELGTEIGKNSNEISSQFAKGLPPIADKIASDMRADIAALKYQFPAT